MNTEMDVCSVDRLKAVSKDANNLMKSNEEFIINSQFEKRYGEIGEILKKTELWSIGSVQDKKNIIKTLSTPDGRSQEIQRICKDGNLFSNSEDAHKFFNFIDIWSFNEVSDVVRGTTNYFCTLVSKKEKFQVLKMIVYELCSLIKIYASNMDKVKTLEKIPVILVSNFSRVLIERCEHLIENLDISESPIHQQTLIRKDVTQFIEILRSTMGLVHKELTYDPKTGNQIFRGPRGGKYMMKDGVKIYMKK
jgi:hypothetical protein